MRTPNATQLNALDRDRRTLNPSAVGPRALRMCELLGGLLGLCLRTRSPLPFELSGYAWLQLVTLPPTIPPTLTPTSTPTLTLTPNPNPYP